MSSTSSTCPTENLATMVASPTSLIKNLASMRASPSSLIKNLASMSSSSFPTSKGDDYDENDVFDYEGDEVFHQRTKEERAKEERAKEKGEEEEKEESLESLHKEIFKLKSQLEDSMHITREAQELNKVLEKKIEKTEKEKEEIIKNHSRWMQSELMKIQCTRCGMTIFGLKTLEKHFARRHGVKVNFSQLDKDIKKKMEEETLRLIANTESSRNAAAETLTETAAAETSRKGETFRKLTMKRSHSSHRHETHSSSVIKKTNGTKVVKKRKTISSHDNDNDEYIQID